MKNTMVKFSTVVLPKHWIKGFSKSGENLFVEVQYTQGWNYFSETRKYEFTSPEVAQKVFDELASYFEEEVKV